MKYFSMFSGIGGFELGIKNSFLQQGQNRKENNVSSKEEQHIQCIKTSEWKSEPICVGYSEIDKYAIQIYEKHFKGNKNYGDCTKIRWEEVECFDLLVGGFPCQAFSVAGRRLGFGDTRGTLFFQIARVLREKQPRLFLLENVKGLLSHDKGNTFLTILTTLDELGYDCQWQVLNSKNFGVPQNRERVFIVGHLRGTSRPEVFPIIQTSRNNLEELTTKMSQGFRCYKDTGTSTTIAGLAGGIGAKTGLYKTRYGIRRLTPTECERLQGFPDGWTEGISDTQRYKCLGNAVTVNVIQSIIERMFS